MIKKLGIFGGTFDPIHHGHLLMARDAMEAEDLDQVLFVPNARSPLKGEDALTPAPQRLEMVVQAIAGHPGFAVSDIELNRSGLSYSVDTLLHLQEVHPDHALYFILGSDSLKEIHQWRSVEKILELCTLLVMARPDVPNRDAMEKMLQLEPALAKKVLAHVQETRHLDISATEIRERCSRDLPIKYLVPEGVERYIEQQQLYKT